MKQLACTEIPFGKGVCGAAAATQQTQVIKDVHQFPGHIACDSASNSEIVVPMILNGVSKEKDVWNEHVKNTGYVMEKNNYPNVITYLQKVIGVLDIDCEKTEGFDQEDRVGLEAIVQALVESCDWKQQSIIIRFNSRIKSCFVYQC